MCRRLEAEDGSSRINFVVIAVINLNIDGRSDTSKLGNSYPISRPGWVATQL
jgi:hypothetical protein